MIVSVSVPVKILHVILPKSIDKNLFACIIQAMIVECIFIGFLSALGWWGANYYVITPYLPEPIFKESKVVDKEKTTDSSKSQ